jgi:hypothetical protein
MTDTLSESDVRRVDERVDPTKVNADDIEDSLNDDFDGQAREAFAEALEQQREPVRQEARELLRSRLDTNPANNATQLRDENGRFGPMASSVQGTAVTDSGEVVAEVQGGENVTLGNVDLNAGARGPRSDEYSR